MAVKTKREIVCIIIIVVIVIMIIVIIIVMTVDSCAEEDSQLKLTEVGHAPLVKQNLDTNVIMCILSGHTFEDVEKGTAVTQWSKRRT